MNRTRASSEGPIPAISPVASVPDLSKDPGSPQRSCADVTGPQITAPTQSQAIVMVDPVPSPLPDSTSSQDNTSSLPGGWNWVLANTSLPCLFERLIGEANLHWSATLLPDRHSGPLPTNDPTVGHRSALFTYAEQMSLPSQLIPQGRYRSRVHLVIINGHQFPLCDLRQAIRLHRRNRADVTVLDLCDSPAYGYDERLLLDDEGQVDRVTRIYGQSSDRPVGNERGWPAIMVLSAEAMIRLAGQPLPRQLALWPAAMLRAGLRLCGHALAGRCYDLHTPQHAHELAEAVLRTRPKWLIDSGHLAERGPRIWVGTGVEIAGTAHLMGPVAIGDDAQIGPEAVVVGPAIVGRGARVAPGTHLRRCLLWPGATGEDQQALPEAPKTSPRPPRSIRLQDVLSTGSSCPLGGLRLRAYRLTKRAIDITGSLLFLAITLPLYAIIAIAIKSDSPGPVFYGHVRQGLGGKNFTCWKFRTMVPNADHIKAQLLPRNEVDGPQFKMASDPRIFRVGRLLRRLNMDEWPQFFNVLRGDMSLVGPRPSPERENQMCPAWREARLSVRPGLTGLWQACRQREEETDFQEWIYYDVQYVKQQSLWLDLKILLWTLRVAFNGR